MDLPLADETQHQVVVHCSLYACLTIMSWDILECLPADVRLVTEFKIKFPSIVYFISRISTLVFLISSALNLRGHCVAFAVSAQCLLAVHRGSTSLLLYLRLHALYRSDPNIRSLFVFVFTMIIAFSMIYWSPKDTISGASHSADCLLSLSGSPNLFWTSAMISCGFDILVFVIITYKLGLQTPYLDATHAPRWRLPLFHSSLHHITHRLFQDNLAYFLLTIFVKTPQIILLPVGGADWQLLILFADATLICVLSGKIFRDMKLGLPGVLSKMPQLRNSDGASEASASSSITTSPQTMELIASENSPC